MCDKHQLGLVAPQGVVLHLPQITLMLLRLGNVANYNIFTRFLRLDAAATIFFTTRFCAATIPGQLLFKAAFISLESLQTPMMAGEGIKRTSDTVTTMLDVLSSKRRLSAVSL